jgi:HSP20 family protein
MEVKTMLRSPFLSDVVALRDSFDRVFSETFGPSQTLWSRSGNGSTVAQPLPLDVYATDDHAVILAAAPGMRPEDVEVTVHQNTVTISGKIGNVGDAEDAKGATWFVHELSSGSYRRSITLPFPINADQVEATFDYGMIRIVAPKAEQAKPRKIAVQTAQQPEAITAGTASQRS